MVNFTLVGPVASSARYSKSSGERVGTPQPDRAVVDVSEAYSGLDLGVYRSSAKYFP